MWNFLKTNNIEIWCICLKERDDRYHSIINEFKKINILNYVQFYRPNKCKDGGRIGCFNSHKHCMLQTLNNNKHALIFEDDIIFSEDWVKNIQLFKKFLNSCIKWDIFKFGNTLNCVIQNSNINNIYKCKSTSTCAILYNKSYIQKCINNIIFNPYSYKLHIDQFFLYDNINEYGFIPSICYQKYCISNNQWDDCMCVQKIWQSKYTLLIQKYHNKQKYLCRFLPICIQIYIDVIYWICLFLSKINTFLNITV
jgi:hypothetical protein